VVAVAWAARGPLPALADRYRRPPAAPSGAGEGDASPLDQEVGTGDDAGVAWAKRGGSGDPDGDARADQAALLGASLAVVLTQFFGAGSWGWWSTSIGLTLLLVVLGYFRISRDPGLDWPRRVLRLLGFAAVIGLCSTVALAYGLQTLRSGSKTPDTNGRSVEDFCKSLGVAAGSKAVDEADKKLLDDKTETEVLIDARKAAADEAADDCLGKYGSTHLGLVGLVAGLLAFVGGALAWRPREPSSPPVDRPSPPVGGPG
jgi:hypothetical protein